MTQQQSLLHKLPSELLGTVIDAVQSTEDLLRLSTSCQLFRNTMTGSFWQRVLDERYKVTELPSKSCKKAMTPRKQVIQRVLRTCYGCKSVNTRKLGKHDILKKPMCATCTHIKYEMMPVTRAKKLYKLKEEDLAGLRVAVKLNPVNHSYKHMRLRPAARSRAQALAAKTQVRSTQGQISKQRTCAGAAGISLTGNCTKPSGDETGSGGETCNAQPSVVYPHRLTSLQRLHHHIASSDSCSLPNLRIVVQAPSQTKEVQPLTPAQPVLPEPLTKVQQVNLRNMCIIADSVAPGVCPIATLAAHALTWIEPMGLIELQQFAAVVMQYRQQQQPAQ